MIIANPVETAKATASILIAEVYVEGGTSSTHVVFAEVTDSFVPGLVEKMAALQTARPIMATPTLIARPVVLPVLVAKAASAVQLIFVPHAARMLRVRTTKLVENVVIINRASVLTKTANTVAKQRHAKVSVIVLASAVAMPPKIVVVFVVEMVRVACEHVWFSSHQQIENVQPKIK